HRAGGFSTTMNQFNQQPAWISASTAETGERVRAFIRTVYAWMAGGLGITALASMWVVNSPQMQHLILAGPMLIWILFFAELGLVVAITAGIRRFSAATSASMFLVYSLLNGLTLSWIFFYYTRGDIMTAFVTAAGMFGAMSLYGLATKRDLTSIG